MVMTRTKRRLILLTMGQELVEEQREKKQMHKCNLKFIFLSVGVRVIVIYAFIPDSGPIHWDQDASFEQGIHQHRTT